MAITLTINGSTRQWQANSLLIDEPLNGQPRLSLEVFSASASWRPSLDEEVIVEQDSTLIFGGVIVQAREHGPGGALVQRTTDIATEITSVGFSVMASYRYVTRSFTSGTLKSYLQALVDDYLDDDGIALYASQVDGPTMPDRDYTAVRLDEVLSEWSALTGYVWEITYDKKLRMFTPGSEAAPTSITAANGKAIGDVTVEPKRGPYFNRVLLKAGQAVQVDKTDTFTGDGTTDEFDLNYPLVYQPQVGYGYVTNGTDNYETLDLAGNGATWEYDPVTNNITRVAGAPANLNAISITYPAQFPILVTAEDAGEIAAHGTREKVISYPNVYDIDVAQDLADAELAKGIAVHREVNYTTEEVGIRPGQTQTITFSARNLDATCTVMQVRTRDVAGKTLHRNVTAVEGSTVIQTSEREQVYADWLAKGDSAAVAQVPTSAGSAVPFPPDKSVQFNRAGAFGGDAAFTYYEDENSVVCGGGGSSITALAFESCQVFGSNCHIGPV